MTVEAPSEIELALRRFLLEQPAIAALVVDRISPWPLGQAEDLPALTFMGVHHNHARSHSGSSHHTTSRIQIDAWGRTWLEARALARLVRLRLHGFRGLAGGRVIQASHATTGPDEFDPDSAEIDAQRGRYRTSADYSVAYGEE